MKDIALVFPGQGSQSVGMGKDFYDGLSQARELFDQADQVVEGLSDIIFNGPIEKLTLTKYCQPAIFTVSCAALKAFEISDSYSQYNIQFSAGHSLGEYSALVACGALSFAVGIRLVERRSYFMDQATSISNGSMAAVLGLNREVLMNVCSEHGIQAANFNSLDQIVVTGESVKVEGAIDAFKAAGAKRVIPLEVSGAFHSSLMQSAQDNFKLEVEKCKFSEPKFPILSNVDAAPCSDPNKIANNLINQITSSVLWVDTIESIQKSGVVDFIEVGPGSVLKGLIRKINKELSTNNISSSSDLEGLVVNS